MLENRDEEDGLAERMIMRNAQNSKFVGARRPFDAKLSRDFREREGGPRFIDENSFEHYSGMKWKELYAYEKRRRDELEDELRDRRRQLEADTEIAYQDFQAERLREELEQRKRELDRLEALKRDRPRPYGRPHGEPSGIGSHMFAGDERGDGPYGRPLTHGRDPSSRYNDDHYRRGDGGEREREREHVHAAESCAQNENAVVDGGPFAPPFRVSHVDPHHMGVERSLHQVCFACAEPSDNSLAFRASALVLSTTRKFCTATPCSRRRISSRPTSIRRAARRCRSAPSIDRRLWLCLQRSTARR